MTESYEEVMGKFGEAVDAGKPGGLFQFVKVEGGVALMAEGFGELDATSNAFTLELCRAFAVWIAAYTTVPKDVLFRALEKTIDGVRSKETGANVTTRPEVRV